jgi:uncharacterized membrane protein YgaE (UPF0421/DUF939 family)
MMQKDTYERIINFLLGASWGVIILGALITFKLFLFLGFAFAFFVTVFFIIISLFMVLALDAFLINKQRLEEAKKQTKLLEKIYAKHTK